MSGTTLVHQEAFPMTDMSPRLNMAALAEPANRTMQLIKLGVLAVSVAAAVPTARDLYFSWKNDVPFSQVQHRLAQGALLEKNFDCKINYRTLTTAANAKVEVGSCSKTGDISIKVIGQNGQVNYEWIAFDQLPKPATQSASWMDLIISQAAAAEATPRAFQTDGMIRVAEASTDPICQAKKKDVIVRVVKEGDKCMQETVSIFKGTVEKRQEVPCDKACPIPN